MPITFLRSKKANFWGEILDSNFGINRLGVRDRGLMSVPRKVGVGGLQRSGGVIK